ncbi:MAG: 4-(cytidine 5'-diphospho)-2-C-methyl-D-erythritol kinase [Lachnospiraceae bacterium]|nr:4-(cytidine 5'-diphospho)-2-C-methyl-D-erythritol kinase [Lachnospiraceae bacterium]
MNELKLKAFAKINLVLDITGRREDGYHDLCSVMQEIGLYDTVVLRKVPSGVHLKVEFDDGVERGFSLVPDDTNNLAYRAAELLLADAKAEGGVEIVLHKNIPVAAGLAGGSTDAATVLRGLNVLYDLYYDSRRLCELGVKLGADVPFCIMGGTALAEGIGEKLQAMPIPGSVCVLLAKPPVAVSTKEVYQAYDRLLETDPPKPADMEQVRAAIGKGDAEAITSCLYNALALVTEPLHPEIVHLREEIMKEGAKGALMSGSGPSVFGLYEDLQEAKAAAGRLQERFPNTFFAAVPFCYNHKELD